MKYVLSLVLFTGVFLSLKYSITIPSETNNKNKTKWFFDADSGYVVKDQFLPFMQMNNLTDTVPEEGYYGTWTFEKATDTIGKYYKLDNGDVILCSINHADDFETHILMQLNKLDNGEIGLVRHEEYSHGNYSCCWNGFDGFNKKGDFFSLKLCYTGSGLCGADLYIFKYFKSQEEILFSKIPYDCWFGNETIKYAEEISMLSSTYDLINDSTLLFHYSHNYYYKKERWAEPKSKKTIQCDAKYTYRDGNWITSDSSCLKKALIIW